MSRRSRALGAAAVAAGGVVVLALVLPRPTGGGGSPEPPEPSGPAPTGAPASASPLACDSPSLNGPAQAPAGAIRVTPSQDLSAVVEQHPAGSTFWLAPGVHRLGRGPYDQVVPRDRDSFVGAPGAVLDGRKVSRYAFTGDAVGVTIAHLTVQNFGAARQNNDEGVVNHDSAAGWSILATTIRRNAGAGLMIGSGNRVVGNCLQDNGQYGFNAYHEDGVRDVELRGNEITGNNTDDWERLRDGCGCTGGGKFWETTGAKVIGNYVHDNHGPGLWVDSNNSEFLIQGNYISGNDAEGLFYETSYNAAVLDNTFARNAIAKGPGNPGFPAAAVYLSESGSDPRVPGDYGTQFVVAGNHFVDNWSGIVAWENADRFAGSPANTSTGVSTLVNPKATVTACSTPSLVAKPPYYDDCRWKTQNLLVERNTFELDPARVSGCSPDRGCGFNGLFSNYGTYPDWSPFKAYAVADHITFRQNNIWRQNTYVGPWSFVARSEDNIVDWNTWRSTPYGQDAGSTLNGSSASISPASASSSP